MFNVVPEELKELLDNTAKMMENIVTALERTNELLEKLLETQVDKPAAE